MQPNNTDLLRNQAYIDGQWHDADNSARFTVYDPADGHELAQVPDMGRNEAARAIDAANRAWAAWRELTAEQRYAPLRRWHDLIVENQEDLARLMTAECGKPIAEARGEVVYGASFVQWFAEEARRVYGDTIPAPSNDRRILMLKQPVGVSAMITPWNFPIAMITRKCAPALAAGCPVVIKPAEATPLSALALARLAEQAGIPAGIFNVVTAASGAEVGREFCENPVVRKLSFTGSTAVGRLLLKQCADTVKKVSLELGGNAPFIVFDDADLDVAVRSAIGSKYRNTGQTCVCANRFLIQDGIYDAFAERFTAAVRELRVGNGLDEGVQQGPLINDAAMTKVEGAVADALSGGARCLTGGERAPSGGNFYLPTVIADVTPEMRLSREETFGPVAPLIRFSSEEEAIQLANDTPYGLAAYFFSREIGRIWRIGEALEYGMVGVNEGVISSAQAPFGGIKQSGLGREGSRYGIEEYLEKKYVCIGALG